MRPLDSRSGSPVSRYNVWLLRSLRALPAPVKTGTSIGTRALALGGGMREPKRGGRPQITLTRGYRDQRRTGLRNLSRSRQFSNPLPYPNHQFTSTSSRQTSHLCSAFLRLSLPSLLQRARKPLPPTTPLAAFNSLWSTTVATTPG